MPEVEPGMAARADQERPNRRDHRIMESFGLEKSSKIIESKHYSTSTLLLNPW